MNGGKIDKKCGIDKKTTIYCHKNNEIWNWLDKK